MLLFYTYLDKKFLTNVVLYWVGKKVCLIFSHKINYIFFIFTNNFIDLDILSMLAISHICLLYTSDAADEHRDV